MLQFVLGGVSTATVLAPFLGRVGGISGRYVALGCLLIAVAAALGEKKRWAPPTKRATVFLLCAALMVSFILLSASPVQWEYASSAQHWIVAPTVYYRSKLVVILVNLIPAVAVIVAGSFISRHLTLDYSKGALVGFVIVGAIAALRLISDSEYIFTDNLDFAWSYLADRNRGYSVVGHGIIYATAALAPLGFVKDNWHRNAVIALICAFFFTCIFVINQRADVVFAAVTLLAACVWGIIFNIRRTEKVRLAPTFVIVSGVFVFGVLNPAHVIYWSELTGGLHSQAFSSRIAAANDAISIGQPADFEEAERLGSTENESAPSEPGAGSEVSAPNSHHHAVPGLGSVALQNPNLLYPHNVALELWGEVGAPATILFVFMALGAAYYAAQFRSLPRAQVALGCGAVLCLIFMHHMKAGDLSSLGLIFWGMWMVWGFPRKGESETA